MSITVNPDLYELCWNQIGDLTPSGVSGINSYKSIVKEENFKINTDKRGAQVRCCISRKDHGYYNISLPITKQRTMNMKVRFHMPLGPQVELVQIRTVPTGIYFILSPALAGADSKINPVCWVILVAKSKGLEIINTFSIDLSKQKFQELKASSFYVYYSCNVLNIFDTSSRFVEISGITMPADKVKEMKPFIQIPLRRFIQATWSHKKGSGKRYDVVIYKILPQHGYDCIKIFRLFDNNFQHDFKSRRILAHNCEAKIPIEDLGCFNSNTDDWISLILDMVVPLDLFSLYKLAIFKAESATGVFVNYVHFTPLPNQCIGSIHQKMIDFNWPDYNQIWKFIPNIDQSVINMNTDNPFYGITLNMPNYQTVDIYSSIMTDRGYNLTYQPSVHVQDLYQTSLKAKLVNNFFPFFYAIYKRTDNINIITEIVQLPSLAYKADYKCIDTLEFVPDNWEYNFKVKWKINNYPNTMTPAMFGIEIKNSDTDQCDRVYLLKCTTCNGIYVKNTYNSNNAKNQMKLWQQLNCQINMKSNRYDASDSFVDFTTDAMTPSKNFSVKIYSFANDIFTESEYSDPRTITQSMWQKYNKVFIGVICTILIAGLLIGLVSCCKYLMKDPEEITSNEKPSKIISEPDEEIYDDDDTRP